MLVTISYKKSLVETKFLSNEKKLYSVKYCRPNRNSENRNLSAMNLSAEKLSITYSWYDSWEKNSGTSYTFLSRTRDL